MAEKILKSEKSGSFLIRVSEKIFGYTLSYVVRQNNIKHFLIQKVSNGYQFLGTNQVIHLSLYNLVLYHQVFYNKDKNIKIFF